MQKIPGPGTKAGTNFWSSSAWQSITDGDENKVFDYCRGRLNNDALDAFQPETADVGVEPSLKMNANVEYEIF